ncbi:MAG TPA: LPS export ABC transporter periplasmic protein LptC [Chryseosolibacter sp.]|nr:LPS export ABC transporter periplasmic protein LptC [Chryseosolibacter sp.]
MINGLYSGNSIKFLRSGRVTITLVAIALCGFLAGCGPSELSEPVEYTGPARTARNVMTHYTEHGRLKLKMNTPLVHEMLDGDREFPEGIELEFYDETGSLESTLRANEAYYFHAENKWRGRGKVEVKNIAKNEQLNTEELFWKPADKKIYTDQFVTIRQQDDVIYGQGLDAKEDMSDYTILKPEGVFDISEEK